MNAQPCITKSCVCFPPPSLATVRCVRYVSVPAGRGRAPLMPALLGRSLLLSRCGLRCQSRWADTRHSVHKERARASCMSVLRDKRGCGTVVQGPDTDRLTHTHKHTHTHTHIHTTAEDRLTHQKLEREFLWTVQASSSRLKCKVLVFLLMCIGARSKQCEEE